MEKVRLGRTDLIVTKIGWGGIPIQRVSEQEAVPVIRAVLEMGVDLLDTARSYTDSEHKIGLALREVDRPVILSSKSQIKTAKIYDDVRESLKQLQAAKVHIYHLHNISKHEEYEQVMAPGGGYEGLQRARDEGLIDHIAISSHSLDLLERVIEEGHFDVIMACYSFLEPGAAKKVFPAARKKDIGILTMKAFSGGVIEEAGPALRYVLGEEDIVPIPGTETLERARENWKIFQEGGALTEHDKERIEDIRKQFDRVFCRRCDYCQPCSEKIRIQFLIGLKTTIKRFGNQVQELKWMKDMIERARNCSACGECMSRCPYQLPIPELIKKNLEWYDNLAK
ncbi:MAG TPA: aldo/keto reductase [Syntrophorhabdales bacterium]|nr:aldo/keto reductase [Syntrophorhabdales bacterium]